jgi:hypothetical protein
MVADRRTDVVNLNRKGERGKIRSHIEYKESLIAEKR